MAGVKREEAAGCGGGPVCSRNAHDQNGPLDARSEEPTPHRLRDRKHRPRSGEEMKSKGLLADPHDRNVLGRCGQ